MTEQRDRVQQLRENYAMLTGDRRWAILAELARTAERHPDKLSPHIDWLLEQYTEETGGTRHRVGRVLQKLLAHRPEPALEVIKKLSGHLGELDNTTRESVYEAALTLQTDYSDELWQALSAPDIEPLLEDGIESRNKAYELLGVTGGPASVKLLVEWLDVEIGDMATKVETEIESLESRASNQLEQNPAAARAAETLEEIANHDPELVAERVELLQRRVTADNDAVARAAAKAIITICESDSVTTGLDIWPLVDKLDPAGQTAYGRMVGAVSTEHRNEFDDVVSSLVTQLETAASAPARTQSLAALAEAARIHNEESFPALDRILELRSEIDDTNRPEYINLLGNIASTSAQAGRLIPVLVDALQSESATVRLEAARGLLNVDIYPAPSALEASKDDPDQTVRELVDAASGQTPQTSVLPFEFEENTESRLVGMDAELKYQTRPGRWEPISVDEYHQTLMENISMAYQSGGSTQIQLPYYEPRAGLLTAFELLLQDSDGYSDTTVVLYSPGTQTHWGTFGDIREAIGQFGFGDDNITGHALPLDDWLILSRVQDTSTKPFNQNPRTGNELVLAKSAADLAAVDNPDAVVCNLQARAPMAGEDIVQEVRSVTPDAPVFLQYSYFTKQEYKRGWPKYGFPADIPSGLSRAISRFPVKALSGSTTSASGTELATPATRARRQVDRLGEARPLTVYEFTNEDIMEPLNEIYGHYKDLDEPGTEELASTVRSRLYGIRRLPVPIDIYNRWVRQEAVSYGRYAPDTTQQLVHSLEQRVDNYDVAYVPASIKAVVNELENLYEVLGSQNPKFTYLTEQIENNVQSQSEMAILFLSEQMLQVFEFGIRETTGYKPEQLEAAGIYLCRPDGFRDLQPLDRLILLSDLPSALASYYLAPGVDKIEVLNFGGTLQSRLTEWVDQHAQQIYDRLGVPDDVEWPAVPDLQREGHGTQVIASSPSDERLVAGPSLAELSREGTTEELAGEFATASSESTPDTVEITTASDKKVRLDFNQSVLLKEHRDSPTDHVWTSAGNLGKESDFVVIPENIRRQLYEETLQELYEEDLAELAYMDSLELWWKTLREIDEEYESIDIIYSLLDRNGLEKSKTAVRDWFRAVSAAEKPLELVEHPELTIGPDSAKDILIIGDTFDRQSLAEHAGLVQNVMERFRKENRQKGRELNEKIIKMIEDPSSDLSSEVVRHKVKSIEYL